MYLLNQLQQSNVLYHRSPMKQQVEFGLELASEQCHFVTQAEW